MPVYQMLYQAGGKLAYDVNRDEFAISGLTAGLDITGSVNGRHLLNNVLTDASRAAAEALAALGLRPPPLGAFGPEAKVNFPEPAGLRVLTFPAPPGAYAPVTVEISQFPCRSIAWSGPPKLTARSPIRGCATY